MTYTIWRHRSIIVRRVLREQIGVLHRRLLAVVRNDDVCRRLMTVPVSGRWWR
jgi:transposase